MVRKIEIVFTSNVIRYLDDLVVTLYKEEYFGFIESAEEYVSNIYDAVPERIKKISPKEKSKSTSIFRSKLYFL
jgi:hypothetical protein